MSLETIGYLILYLGCGFEGFLEYCLKYSVGVVKFTSLCYLCAISIN